MAADPTVIEKTTDPGTQIETLKVTGPVTLATLFEFQGALREATGPKTLIDFSGVPYMDSAGLGAVLNFYASAQRHGRRHAIVGMSPRILTMFQVSKVDKFLSIYPSVEEGARSLE
ncbi:STAS domain-containing protein [Nevskia soli]|jgi:anti-anti-sigma factor|uniref:STAS domain-containing protein n=1 Tax=Nevskia soli TaxID=418856 RepID=UPI0015D823B2|nr:STAS domain-containing protein [Nevskia soli]